MHGGAYLAWKTDGAVRERCANLTRRAAVAIAVLWPAMTVLTIRVDGAMFSNFAARPLAWACTVLALAGLVVAIRGAGGGRGRRVFFGTTAFLLGLMAATATSVYPVMLRSVGDASLSITADAASNDIHGLRTALGWWLVGIPLVIAYFVIQFRVHAGTVTAPGEGDGGY